MDKKELRVRARKSLDMTSFFDHIELYAAVFSERGELTVATGLTFDEVHEFALVPPLLDIDATAAQVLMDDLWACGVRPTEGAGSAGAMRVVERHLEDMRCIVQNKLHVEFGK